MRHFLPLVLILSFLAASCGSSTSSTADTTTSSPPDTVAETTTTSEVVLDTDSDDAVIDDYCASVNEIDARFAAADFNDPVAVEAALAFQIDTMRAADIPPAIEGDIATMLTTSDDYYQLLETVDFDLMAVETDIIALFDEPAIETAAQNIDEFELQNCPIILGDDVEVDENPLGLTEDDVLEMLQNPAGRAGIAEGIVESTPMTLDQANCFLDETDPNVVAALFSIGVGDQTQVDPDVSGGLFEGLLECDMSIDMFG